MADSKVSELTSATSAGGSDQLYLVQSNTSKKITVGTLLSTAGNVTLSGNITIGNTPQTLAAAGIISLAVPITHVQVDTGTYALQIPTGYQGQIKYIAMTSSSGGKYTLTSNIAGNGTITFDRNGDTAQLLFTNNKWYVVGGTANVTY